MESKTAGVLPYRTEGAELARWLEARARGRTPVQIRSLDFGAKAYDGTLAGAQALGFVEPGRTELTEAGRAYALATPAARVDLLRGAMATYEPYALLLEAIFARGVVESTETSWIETWWATHGYGASTTNRAEGAVAFARLADFAGLGSYVQGRRGHPSRIEWPQRATLPTSPAGAPAAVPAGAWGDLWSAAGSAAPEVAERAIEPPHHAPVADVTEPLRATSAPRTALGPATAPATAVAHSSAVVDLGGGRVATLRVPAQVSQAERSRLVELLELLLDAHDA